MKLVIDAKVAISAFIDDSTTRELIVTLGPKLITPAYVYDEIENYRELIAKKREWSRTEWSSSSSFCSSTSRSFPRTISTRLSSGQTKQSE